MTTTKTKRKRIRITRNEIDKARESLGQEQQPKSKATPRPQMPKGFWQDGIYCDPFGWAWGLAENLDSVCLGRTEEVIKGEDSFPQGKVFNSGHLRVKNDAPPISLGGTKSIVATFKKAPQFLRLLERLISQDLGIRAMHSELKARGYEIPLRTLGRWIQQKRGEK